MSLPISTHIESYKRPDTNKAHADQALVWLHTQYQKTNASALKEFEKLWHSGKPAPQPVDFRNVAKFYDPNVAHQKQAVHYLDSHISPGTLQMFDDIWFGRNNP
jgi:hypothetical protein